MIKLEFPADRADIALALSVALQQIATGTAGAHVALAERLQHHELVDEATNLANERADLIRSGAHAVTEHGVVDTATGALLATDPVPHMALSTADSEAAHAGDPSRLDLKGVPFDARYCANAQDPFYASGKEAGQWKAKRGLAAGVYEQWYATQLATTTQAPADEDTDPTPTVATGAAFGAAPQQPAGPILRTAGEFMAWVSEKQTAGKLTQEAINAAYAQLGIRVQDLFPPTPDNVIANNIAALYGHLSPFAGA